MVTPRVSAARVRSRAFPLSRVLAALLPALAAAPVLAQQQQPAAPVSAGAALQETVVTATRVEQPLSDLVADVSIVDRATIERSGADGVADVLARLPGVEITRNGSVGNTTSVFLRGAETRFTAVYIDGVRVDSQSTGGALWESIPLSQIDRIEVLRGPAAAVYGSDAIGGVIQLFTRKGSGPLTPTLGFGLGSHGLVRTEAGLSGSAGEGGAFDYSLSLSRETADGFNVRPLSGYNPDRDGYESSAASLRLGWRLSDTQRLDASLLSSYTNAGYDNSGYNASYPQDDRSRNTLRTAGLTWTSQWTEAWKTRLSVTDSAAEYDTRPAAYNTQTRLRGYLFQNELRFGPHLVTAALERREDRLVNASTLNLPTRIGGRATVTRGLSGERAQDAVALGYGYNQGPHTLQLNVRHDDDSEFGGKTTGSAAYGYAITPEWKLTASGGTAFRAPTLYQRYSEYGIASLQPETSRNVEVGLRWASGVHYAGIVVFRNRVSNLISFGAAGACASSSGCYGNTAQAEYKGVTLSGGTRIGEVSLGLSMDFQDPRDLDNDLQLARRARRHASLSADTRLGIWTVGAEAQLSSRRPDRTAANSAILPGYGVLNLYAQAPVADQWTFLARLDNAGDKDYQLASGYATAGRTLYLGVKWSPR